MEKDKKQKDISINDLAIIMARGFEQVDKQLKGMDVKLDYLREKTDTILEYACNIDDCLDEVSKDVKMIKGGYIKKSELRKITI